jgi:hypothetical protein
MQEQRLITQEVGVPINVEYFSGYMARPELQ